MAIACPNCAFQGASILFDGSRKCASCGRVYHADFEYPQPPGPAAAMPVAAGAAQKKVGVVAALALVMGAGIVAFVYAARSEPPEGPRPDPLPQAEAPEPEPVESGRLAAEIGPEVVVGSNGVSPWWLVEYRNTGEVSISFPKVRAHAKDEQGRAAFDHEAAAWVYRLAPGESVWILVNPTGSHRGRFTAQFEVIGPVQATRSTPRQLKLELPSHEMEPNPSPGLRAYPFLVGRLRNNSKSRLGSVHVMAVGYNLAGQPCAFAHGYARSTSLQAGEESDFRLGTGTWQAELPATWRVEAWGNVRN
ncbi:MAG: hypothetical protein H6841_10830 [Planctomycetes bacterium]|nr:hypothetical protein [Planctomycetota bacterium]MCB9936265.1 hypothetical protein [Planctomycetota bacterium]